MEFNEKIKALRIEAGATLEEIGNVVGVSKATVQRWESGDIKNIRRDKIAKLAKALHTTPAYLMDWEDADEILINVPVIAALLEYCERYDKDQDQILRFYREYPASLENLRLGNTPKAIDDMVLRPILGMSISDACSVVGMPLVPSESFYNNESFSPSRGVKIPVLGSVAAGIPIEAVEDILDYEEITPELAATGEFFALKIKGHSMEPRIMDGDVVVVRRQDDVDSGDVAVVLVNGDEATVKKVKKQDSGISLVPNNPSFDILFYTRSEIAQLPVRILGKVVELRGKL